MPTDKPSPHPLHDEVVAAAMLARALPNPDLELDLAQGNPEIFAALSKAQGQVETVGKDGRNTQANYAYASAEAMIRGSRKPLADNGLAFLSSWSRQEIVEPTGDIGKQFVCANVRIRFALTHAEGGVITGRAELDAIGSPRRPPDKAVAATLTYMRGFVLRELLNMDRASEDADAVDARDETDGWQRNDQGRGRQQQRRQDAPRGTERKTTPAAKPPAQRPPSRPPPPAESGEVKDARRAIRAGAIEYMDLCKALGIKADTADELASAALGKAFDRQGTYTVEEWNTIGLNIGAAIADTQAIANRRAADKGEDPPFPDAAVAPRESGTVCSLCGGKNDEHTTDPPCPNAPGREPGEDADEQGAA